MMRQTRRRPINEEDDKEEHTNTGSSCNVEAMKRTNLKKSKGKTQKQKHNTKRDKKQDNEQSEAGEEEW